MRLTQLKEATKEDETLCRLKATIEKGWPAHRKSAEPSMRQYWGIRDELHVAEHLIFKGERVVIPSCMRADVLKKVHETHLTSVSGGQFKYGYQFFFVTARYKKKYAHAKMAVGGKFLGAISATSAS